MDSINTHNLRIQETPLMIGSRIIEKIILFTIGFFLFFSSCENSSPRANKKIEVSDSLNVVIDKYKDHFLKEKGHLEGVVSIKFHRFCQSNIVEISHIEHWIEFYRGYPNFYSYQNNNPFFIFNGMGPESGLTTMDSMEIRKVLKDISIMSMDVPPNTGFYPACWTTNI